ncbi:MAG: mevalonate kinase [Oceanospirillaceae bacterium]|nr:mevalonate kinase [Oceanospirillaceae bacterium]
MTKKITASAPGSVMLMGEHAVVKGYWAIACALDKNISVTLTPRTDRKIYIRSELATYSASLDHLISENRLSFVLKAIQLQLPALTAGFELDIHAEFSHTLGLGSSAAVTVATIKVLTEYTNTPLSRAAHLQKSLAVVHAVQGRGSGTDLAASIYGGVIAYKIDPCEVIPLSGLPVICLHYVGYKTTTPTVLSMVAKRAKRHPHIYRDIYKMMGSVTCAAISAVKQQDWQNLGELMNIYQGQMDSLGVSDANLCEMIYTLRQDPRVQGAKISGSGLGDCVISLGAEIDLAGFQQIKLTVAKQGVSLK